MNAYLAGELTTPTSDVRCRLCVSTHASNMRSILRCRKPTIAATSNPNGRAASITMRSVAGTAGFL